MVGARLEVCKECNKHGHIILADGFLGLTFAWQEHGLQIIDEGIAYERFTPEEAVRMSRELKISRLPLKFEEVDPKFAWKVHLYNLVRADPEGYVIVVGSGDFNEQVHYYLQAPPEEPMPKDFIEQVKKKMKSFRQ